MKYEKIKDFQEKQFRRITGVKRSTFDKMVEIISAAEKIKKARGGRPNNLSVEDYSDPHCQDNFSLKI